MARNNSNNQDYTNETDGFKLGGGVTKRFLRLLGGDVKITGTGSSKKYDFPSQDGTLLTEDGNGKISNGDKKLGGDLDANGNDINNVNNLDASGNVDFSGASSVKLPSGSEYDGEKMFDTGSNSDGQWVRLPNGTQICWASEVKCNYTGDGWRIKTYWTFPKSFKSTSSYSVTPTILTDMCSMAPNGDKVHLHCETKTKTKYQTSVRQIKTTSAASFGSGDYVYMDFMAIGKWK